MELDERRKLLFIRVRLCVCALHPTAFLSPAVCCCGEQEIGFTHMRIADGVTSLLQLTGLMSRLCQIPQ
jgi:hypothetical protein